jgi:hypothetical protein
MGGKEVGMDMFWAELTNPGAIVRTLILAVVGFYLVRKVDQYWSYRSVKSIKRRIQDMEDKKLVMDDLATSDKSILLFFSKRFFVIVAVGSLAFMLPAISVSSQVNDHVKEIIYYVVLCAFGFCCRVFNRGLLHH